MRIGWIVLGIGMALFLAPRATWSQEGEVKKESQETEKKEEPRKKEAGEKKEAPPQEQAAEEGKGDARAERVRKLLSVLGIPAAKKKEIIMGMKLQMPHLPDSFWEDLITDEDIEGLEEVLVPIYLKHFTDEEVAAWLAFYQTPLGQQIAKKQKEMTADLLGGTQEWGMKIAPKIIAKLMEQNQEPEPEEAAGEEPEHVANETSAIGSLRTLSSVQAQFREGDRENDGTLDFATSLAELSNAGLIDNVLGSGTKSGYVFSLSGSTFDWQCAATPVDETSGKRNFIICTDGVVRFSSGKKATCSSPALQ